MKSFYFILLLFFFQVQAVPFEGTKIVVSGPSPYLPKIVKTLHKQGSNIFDVAIASALSLSVTHPYYVSLGAGGFALLKKNNSIKALDFREKAPQKMDANFYVNQGLSSQTGGAAVGTPGFIAGLWAIHKKYGKTPWARLVQPALQLAKKGFPVSGDWAEITSKQKKKFNSFGKKNFFKNKKNYMPGEVFKQAQLVKALTLIQKRPLQSFYGGSLGKDIVQTVQENKGLMEIEDLKNYQVRWLDPLKTSFKGYTLYSMPLPSSGGIILFRALYLIEKQKLYRKALYSAKELHLLGEIMARAFRPRNLMGDPANFPNLPPSWLNPKHLNKLNQTLSPHRVHHLKPLKEPTASKESLQTTHISLVDQKGNAVSMTLTLNGFYGSGLVSKKYGIVLNNQMDDFTTLPNKPNMFGMIQGQNNAVIGGRTPLSSMTPLIAEQGENLLSLGGAGGPMIINSVLQVLYRHLIHKMNVEEAILAPRIHHQFLPRKLFVENKRFNPELILQLKRKGHKIHYRNYIAQIFGVNRDKGGLKAGHDSRREGASGGY